MARRKRSSLLRSGAVFCIAALWVAATAQAETFRLGRWTGFAEASYDHSEETREGADDPLFDRARFEQRIGLRNRLTVVAPSVLQVHYGLTLGFVQNDFDAGLRGGSSSGEGRITGFDVTAGFFPQRRFSLDLLANRYESVVPQEFAGTTEIETRLYGATFRMRRIALPGSLTYRDLELETSASSDPLLRGRDERRRSLLYQGERDWDRHRVAVRAEANELVDRLFPSLDHQGVRGSVHHTYELPKLVVGGTPDDPELRRPGTLTSTLSYSDRGGNFDSSTFNWTESLRLRHRERVFSTLVYQRRGFDTIAGRSDIERAAFTYRHGFYESLETEARIESRRTNFDNGESHELETRFDADYVKTIPGGRLRLGVDLGYLTTDDQFEGGETFVSREQHTARFGEPFRLDRPNVILSTLLLTDESGSALFLLGVDYVTTTVGRFVEVSIIPGGGIDDGATVLADYRVEVGPRAEFETRTSHARAALDFGWIEPFATWHERDERLRSGFDIGNLDDLSIRTRGVIFRWRKPRWSFDSRNELETRRSRLLAYEAVRLEGRLTARLHRAWSATLSAQHRETDFELPLRLTRRESLRANLEWRPTPSTSVELFGGVRNWEDTLSLDEEFENTGVRARFRRGHLLFSGTLAEWTRRRGEDEFESLRATLQITRRFLRGAPSPQSSSRSRSGPWMGDIDAD